ncbi:Error-prone repair protein ImuA [Chitinophaga sp.]|uniref:ImuA family protein n=1 Tax=Chitinophaga sp. TaxID=1869181 RepID=UPI0031DFC220
MLTDKAEVLKRLQQEILHLQGFKSKNNEENVLGLGPIEAAFPNGVFATGAIHEFVAHASEETAATFGFVSAVLSKLLTDARPCIWICPSRSLFPLALKKFNIEPFQIIFIETATDPESLWVMEEALKCDGIGVVVAEIARVSFSQSRRLQLAVEKSKVTGLLLRSLRSQNTLASIARWHITPLPSVNPDGFPGMGYPQWQVELMKVRNGKPGTWKVAWLPDGFRVVQDEFRVVPDGVRVMPDEFRAAPDGVRVMPDEFRVVPDGVRVVPDEFRVAPDGVKVAPVQEMGIQYTAPIDTQSKVG